MQIRSQLIYIEITYLHFSHVWQRATQETVLFQLISSRFLLPIASLSLSLYASHEAVPTIGTHASPLRKPVKQLLSALKPLRCSSGGREAPAPHGSSKTHRWSVRLSVQPWLRDYRTDFLGCFGGELLVFTAVARGLPNYSPFVMVVLQSYSKMVRVSLCNQVLRYFKLAVQ